MQKSEAVKIIISCAAAYRNNLVNTNLQIAYREGQELKTLNAVFLPRHFMHLTGVKKPKGSTMTSVQFYKKCLDKRLSEDDFEFAEDGTTPLKLSVLPRIMNRNLSARMIGTLQERTFTLYSEKVAGSITACMGFVLDESIGYYVPNTVLKRDIRDVTKKRYSRILLTRQKGTTEAKYTESVYCAKGIEADAIVSEIN